MRIIVVRHILCFARTCVYLAINCLIYKFTRSRTMHLYRTQSGREKQLTADRSQQTVKETTNFSIHLTSCKHSRRFCIKRADLVTNPSIIEMMVNCWVITPFFKTCASLIYLKAEDSWVSQASLK